MILLLSWRDKLDLLPLWNFLIMTAWLWALCYCSWNNATTKPIYTSHERYYKGFTNLHPELPIVPFRTYLITCIILHQHNCYSNYLICWFCVPISIIKLNLFQPSHLTQKSTIWFGKCPIYPYLLFFWRNYHPDFVPFHDFEVSMSLHLNPRNKSMVFHSFCKILLLSNIDKFDFLPLGNFLIRTVTSLALWYCCWNNATNRTNLHLFGTTLLVSPIYTLEFLIYLFWAYLNLCIV